MQPRHRFFSLHTHEGVSTVVALVLEDLRPVTPEVAGSSPVAPVS